MCRRALPGSLAFVSATGRNSAQRFDWFGFVVLGVAIGALQRLLDCGQVLDGFAPGEITAEMVAAATMGLIAANIMPHGSGVL